MIGLTDRTRIQTFRILAIAIVVAGLVVHSYPTSAILMGVPRNLSCFEPIKSEAKNMISGNKNLSRWAITHTTNSEVATKVKISEEQIFRNVKEQIYLSFDKILNEEEALVLAYILSGKGAYILSGKGLKDICHLSPYTSKSCLKRKIKDIASRICLLLSIVFSESVNIYNLRSLAEKDYLNNKVYRERTTK